MQATCCWYLGPASYATSADTHIYISWSHKSFSCIVLFQVHFLCGFHCACIQFIDAEMRLCDNTNQRKQRFWCCSGTQLRSVNTRHVNADNLTDARTCFVTTYFWCDLWSKPLNFPQICWKVLSFSDPADPYRKWLTICLFIFMLILWNNNRHLVFLPQVCLETDNPSEEGEWVAPLIYDCENKKIFYIFRYLMS